MILLVGEILKNMYMIFSTKVQIFLATLVPPFMSKYGTDVLTIDRYKDYYIKIDFCEQNCEYLGIKKSYKNLGGT